MPYAFDHVHVKSSNPGKTADWYVKAFNFNIVSDTVRAVGDRFIRCQTPDGVVVNISGARTDEQMGDGDAVPHWGLEHFGLNVDDMDAEIERLTGPLQPVDEHVETRGRLIQPSEIVLQQRQLEPGGAEGVGRRDRLQARLGGGVVPTKHIQPGQQRRGRRVGGVPGVRQLARLVVGAMRECPCRRAVKLLLLRPRVAALGRRRRGPDEHDAQDAGENARGLSHP